jgi:hypothetical protein
MKRLINRKIYDTATAEKIAYWDNDQHGRDFGFMSETLYRTRKGNYFVHGQGGPMTIYASHAYGGRMAGESLDALTDAAAIEWCEARCIDPDIIAAHFSIDEA